MNVKINTQHIFKLGILKIKTKICSKYYLVFSFCWSNKEHIHNL